MKTIIALAFFLGFVALNTQQAHSNIKIGEPAPKFILPAADGNIASLDDYRGKYVVIEWANFDCPFVKKHYDTENMQNLQAKYMAKDVVWILICSSAPGKQGYFDNSEINNRLKKHNAAPTTYLIDEAGAVGKAYGAKTTPDMRIINPEGILIYAGAIDDKPTTSKDDVKNARNYVAEALDAVLSGKEIKESVTKPYGCSVKYADE